MESRAGQAEPAGGAQQPLRQQQWPYGPGNSSLTWMSRVPAGGDASGAAAPTKAARQPQLPSQRIVQLHQEEGGGAAERASESDGAEAVPNPPAQPDRRPAPRPTGAFSRALAAALGQAGGPGRISAEMKQQMSLARSSRGSVQQQSRLTRPASAPLRTQSSIQSDRGSAGSPTGMQRGTGLSRPQSSVVKLSPAGQQALAQRMAKEGAPAAAEPRGGSRLPQTGPEKLPAQLEAASRRKPPVQTDAEVAPPSKAAPYGAAASSKAQQLKTLLMQRAAVGQRPGSAGQTAGGRVWVPVEEPPAAVLRMGAMLSTSAAAHCSNASEDLACCSRIRTVSSGCPATTPTAPPMPPAWLRHSQRPVSDIRALPSCRRKPWFLKHLDGL